MVDSFGALSSVAPTMGLFLFPINVLIELGALALDRRLRAR